MIFQTTSGILSCIREFGCYYMDVLWHAVRLNPEDIFLTVQDINHVIYNEFVGKQLMSPDCYVKYPEDMFRYFGLDVVYKGKFPNDRVCADGEFEILKWELPAKGWTHFVAGNGIGFTTYDPWGVSETASRGHLHSKRIFEVVG